MPPSTPAPDPKNDPPPPHFLAKLGALALGVGFLAFAVTRGAGGCARSSEPPRAEPAPQQPNPPALASPNPKAAAGENASDPEPVGKNPEPEEELAKPAAKNASPATPSTPRPAATAPAKERVYFPATKAGPMPFTNHPNPAPIEQSQRAPQKK